MKIGDIIRHFKFELLSDAEKAQNKYIYRVESFATNIKQELRFEIINHED